VLRDTTTHGLTAEIPITPRQLAGILKLVEKRTISGKQAKDLYAKVKGTTRSAEDVASELGMSQIADPAQIEAVCARAIEQNPRQLASYRAGKEALFGFFVGQVMKETGGRASPQIVNETLKRLLGAP
jgi:aspartyl-tRNA(Asn)/glutamyl-tRNA(Gln) amidotransferase subunit B